MSGSVNISQRDAFRRRRDKQIVQAIGSYISGGSGSGSDPGTGGSTPIDILSLLSEIFEVVNPGQAGQYLRCKLPLAGDYEIQALSDPGWLPSGATSRAFQTSAFADPLELDATTFKNFKPGPVTGNTIINLNNATDGDIGLIELIIDSTGGYTVEFGTMFLKKIGSAEINTDPDADNFIVWRKVIDDIAYEVLGATALEDNRLKDKDGNVYTSIIIGDLEVIVENLKTTKYADGTSIQVIAEGFSDWYLPSLDELSAMYTELKAYSVGDFTGDTYWSSSEQSATNAQVISFYDGTWDYYGKETTLRVRACRAFTSASPSYSLRDIGPGGGLIFYKNGNDYMEAAPEDQSSAQAWSNITDTWVTSTSTDIGTGQANAEFIIAQPGHTNSAAKLCDDLVVGWASDTAGAMCWQNNNISQKSAYGGYYNYPAIINESGFAYLERNGIQETGWRVPSVVDWGDIEVELGGPGISPLMREAGSAHWNDNSEATNASGFTARGAGMRTYLGDFVQLLEQANFWASDSPGYYSVFLDTTGGNLMQGNEQSQQDGLSVRLVRDIVG